MIMNINNLKFLYQNSVGYEKAEVFRKLILSEDPEILKYLYQNSVGYEKDEVFRKLILSEDSEILKYLHQNSVGYEKDEVFRKLISLNDLESQNSIGDTGEVKSNQNYSHDFFISHATEDKNSIARPLAIELENRNFKVWYDEFTLVLGDSLRRKIDKGLSTSQYGIVILSHSFFQKEWPQKELDALVAREDGKEKVILPIWHNITKEDILRYSPLLSDKLAVPSNKGVNFIVDEITKAYSSP